MPATAGRVRMPANNRVHSSAALQTHNIWQTAIGYDPYKEVSKESSQPKSSNAEPEPENAYASFQGLLALARITGSNADEARGACKKCGRVGHLTYLCKNFLSLKEDKDKDPAAIQAAVEAGLENFKSKGFKFGGKNAAESSEESSDEEESEDSDSDVDSEIERVLAAGQGKKVGSKTMSSSKRKGESDDSGSGDRRKIVRSKKRRSKKRICSDSDDDESCKKRKREKRRRRDSSDEDDALHDRYRKSRKDKRRRSNHYSDDYDESSRPISGRVRELHHHLILISVTQIKGRGSQPIQVLEIEERELGRRKGEARREYAVIQMMMTKIVRKAKRRKGGGMTLLTRMMSYMTVIEKAGRIKGGGEVIIILTIMMNPIGPVSGKV